MNSDRATASRAPERSNLTFGTIMASVAFVMELTLIPLLLSAIQKDLALTVGELAWVFNAYAVAVAVAVLSSGIMGDIVDKRRLFVVGVLLFTVGSILCAYSSGLQGLIFGRIVQGFGGGLFSPLVPILLTQANAGRSGKILMIWGGLVGVVAAALPIVGNVILANFGWRAIFVVFSSASALALVFVSISRTEQRFDLERKIPDYKQLANFRRYWLLLIYIFLVYGCFTYFLFYFPIKLNAEGIGSHYVSLLLTCVWLSFSLLSFLLRDKMEGSGLNASLLVAPVLLALSFAIGFASNGAFSWEVLAAIAAGAGLACCNSPSTHLLLRLAPKDLRAFSSSLDITFARCGGVATVMVLSAASQSASTITVAVLSALAVVCCVLVLRDGSSAH